MKKILCISFILILICSTGCGSGKSTSRESAPIRPTGTISGVAHDGPIINGTISAYRWDNGLKGEFIGSTETDSFGGYQLELQTSNGPILLEVTGGSYLEEASGDIVSLTSQQSLSSLVFYENGSILDAQITHYTYWAKCYTEYLLDNETLTIGNAIIQANEIISNIAEIPITSSAPVDITRPENFSKNLTVNHLYGYLLAAISGAVADIAKENNAETNSLSLYTSIHFSSLVCKDIQADGYMNGKGENSSSNPTGQIYIGTFPINVNVYRSLIAGNILKIANSEANQVGFTAENLLSYANKISLNRNSIYPQIEPIGVDLSPPLIVPAQPTGSVIAGQTILDFHVSDPLGIDSIEFFIDGDFYQTGDPENPKMSIITNNYLDGEHTITVVATDKINNKGSETFTYSFLNTAPAINLTSSTLVNSENYLLTGTVNSDVAIDRIEVFYDQQSVVASVNENLWSADIKLKTGLNTITINASDIINNTSTSTYSIGLDSNSPIIRTIETDATFSDGTGQLNLCTYGQLNDEVALTVPICLSTSNLELKGEPISISLPKDGFIIAGFEIEDINSGGLFTYPEQLVTEYRYLKGNEQSLSWTATPRQSGLLIDTILIPLTTDFFGPDFYKTTTETIHTIELRVTDKANNISIQSYRFKIDVIIPELKVSSELYDPLLSTSFENRTALSGKKILFSHTLNNINGTDLFIRINPEGNHLFTQSYLGILRENIGRYKNTTHWQAANSSISPWIDTDYLITVNNLNEIRPSINYDEARSYLEDNPKPNETDWKLISQPNGVSCLVGGIFGGKFGDFFINGSNIPACRFRPNGSYQVFLRERIVSNYEPNIGYPLNRITQHQKQLEFSTGVVNVFNTSQQRDIIPIRGWYAIPANSILTIEVEYPLPEFIANLSGYKNIDDTDVSYTNEAFYDDQLEWNINSTIVIYRSIATTQNDIESNINTYAQSIGEKNVIFRIQ